MGRFAEAGMSLGGTVRAARPHGVTDARPRVSMGRCLFREETRRATLENIAATKTRSPTNRPRLARAMTRTARAIVLLVWPTAPAPAGFDEGLLAVHERRFPGCPSGVEAARRGPVVGARMDAAVGVSRALRNQSMTTSRRIDAIHRSLWYDKRIREESEPRSTVTEA